MVIPKPNEIRVIRIKREAFLNYVYSSVLENHQALFKLPADEGAPDYVFRIFDYDSKMHDFIFYVCNKDYKVDETKLVEVIRDKIPLIYREYIENQDWHPIPYSIIQQRSNNKGEKKVVIYNKEHTANVMTVLDVKRKRKLRKNEIRAVRLSEHEIFYLTWYHWIETQEEYMGVPGIRDVETADEIEEKYNFYPMFFVSPINWIEEGLFFLVNEKEYRQVDFEVLEAYCRNYIPFCDEQIFQKPSDSYYSVINWKEIGVSKKQE